MFHVDNICMGSKVILPKWFLTSVARSLLVTSVGWGDRHTRSLREAHPTYSSMFASAYFLQSQINSVYVTAHVIQK